MVSIQQRTSLVKKKRRSSIFYLPRNTNPSDNTEENPKIWANDSYVQCDDPTCPTSMLSYLATWVGHTHSPPHSQLIAGFKSHLNSEVIVPKFYPAFRGEWTLKRQKAIDFFCKRMPATINLLVHTCLEKKNEIVPEILRKHHKFLFIISVNSYCLWKSLNIFGFRRITKITWYTTLTGNDTFAFKKTIQVRKGTLQPYTFACRRKHQP